MKNKLSDIEKELKRFSSPHEKKKGKWKILILILLILIIAGAVYFLISTKTKEATLNDTETTILEEVQKPIFDGSKKYEETLKLCPFFVDIGDLDSESKINLTGDWAQDTSFVGVLETITVRHVKKQAGIKMNNITLGNATIVINYIDGFMAEGAIGRETVPVKLTVTKQNKLFTSTILPSGSSTATNKINIGDISNSDIIIGFDNSDNYNNETSWVGLGVSAIALCNN